MAKSEKEKRLRLKAIYVLGGACKCCGETEPEFLQFDHIHSTGSLARGLGQSTKKLMRKIAAGELSHAVQLLCANCHFSKTIHGECIHKRQELDQRTDRRVVAPQTRGSIPLTPDQEKS